VAIHHLNQEATSRGARMLRTALGPAIALWLEDASVVEVMLNPDGRLWIDRLAGGLVDTGERLSPDDGERIVRLVAHHVGAEVHPGSPRVSAELPETGERFEGLLPPVVAAPAFAIRKPAVAVFTLDDYVAAGIMGAVATPAELSRLPGVLTSRTLSSPSINSSSASGDCASSSIKALILSRSIIESGPVICAPTLRQRAANRDACEPRSQANYDELNVSGA